jgi:hypothetical protein
VAKRVGPIWNFGEDQELRNMFKRTPQPGLWFIAGSFAQCLSIRRFSVCRSRRRSWDFCRLRLDTAAGYRAFRRDFVKGTV